MKNYSRTAMLIPFQEYLNKIAAIEKENEKKTDVVPSDYENAVPQAIVGDVYPDLFSQAAYINKDIREVNQKIAEFVKEMFDNMGDDAIQIQLDSISEHLDCAINIDDSCEEEYTFTRQELIELSSDVYCRKKIAKTMLHLYLQHKRLKDLKEQQEMTKKNILF